MYTDLTVYSFARLAIKTAIMTGRVAVWSSMYAEPDV